MSDALAAALRDLAAGAGPVGLGVVAAVCLLLVLLWGVIFPDPLQRRVRSLRSFGAEPATGGRAELAGTWYEPLYEPMLRLSRLLTDDLRLRLRRAGHQGHGAVVTFMLVKLGTPVVLFPVGWAYLDLTLGERLPGWVLVAIAGVLALGSAWAPDLYLRNLSLRRREKIKRAWPDTLVLLRLCISAGLVLEAALSKVAREMRDISPEVAEELDITVAELIYFQNRREALQHLGDRCDLPMVREVSLALAQAERYGMALSSTLQRLAEESRRVRLAEAEKRAASLPALLTVPMILFFLPALFVVILSPALIQVFGFN